MKDHPDVRVHRAIKAFLAKTDVPIKPKDVQALLAAIERVEKAAEAQVAGNA